MGILAAPLGGRFAATGYAATDDYWYEPRFSHSSSVSSTSVEQTMTIAAFYACVTYIAEDVAKIPLNMFEDLGSKGHRPAPTHPLQSKLHDLPNRYQSALEFREMMTAFAMLRGRGIAEIRGGPRPVLDDEYVPLHPDLIRIEVLRGGERRYVYRDPTRNFEPRTLLDDQVFIVTGRLGRAVIDFARDSITLAHNQEGHASSLFSRGATFKGAIQRERPWNPPGARDNFRKQLDEYAANGQYSGRPLLLEDGMTWRDVGMKSTDAELLDSRRFSAIEGCRWFRIPPHKIFELERSTNNNIERQSVDYVVDSLLGWTERWEQAIWRDLILAKGRFFAEHNLDGLLRGDIETRFKAYALAVQWGWMVRNEVRAKENMNPIEGLDKPLTPTNMTVGNSGDVRVEYDTVTPLLTAGSEDLRGLLKLHASDAAARVVRRETAAIAKLAEKTAGNAEAFRAGVDAFYADHSQEVAGALHIAEHDALRYAREHRDALLSQGPAAMDEWLTEGAAALTELAMTYGPGPAPATTEGEAAA